MHQKELNELLRRPWFTEQHTVEQAGEVLRVARAMLNDPKTEMTAVAIFEAMPIEFPGAPTLEWTKLWKYQYWQCKLKKERVPIERPTWNDYFLTRWLINESREALAGVLMRSRQPGAVADQAKQAISELEDACLDFEEAVIAYLNAEPMAAVVLRPVFTSQAIEFVRQRDEAIRRATIGELTPSQAEAELSAIGNGAAVEFRGYLRPGMTQGSIIDEERRPVDVVRPGDLIISVEMWDLEREAIATQPGAVIDQIGAIGYRFNRP